MKAAALCALVILFVGGTVGAEPVSFGIAGGLALSEQDFDYTQFGDPQFDRRTGLLLGAFAEVHASGPVYGSLGLAYTQKGISTTVREADLGDEVVGTRDIKAYVEYAVVGLALKIRPELGRVDPFVMAGPRLDIKIGDNNEPGFDEVYSDFAGSVWGLTFGGGMEFAVTPAISALLGVAYNLDLEDSYETDLLTVKNESIDLVTGIRF